PPLLYKFNAYVTLKVQNVKSTTITVRGNQPCWEQDFMFCLSFSSLSPYFSFLINIFFCVSSVFQEGPGEWTALDSEVLMKEDQICGTTNPTAHQVLLDTRFELPFGAYHGVTDRKTETFRTWWFKMLEDRNQTQQMLLQTICIVSNPAYDDHDSAVDDRDSDYRSETGNRPPPFHNASQTNSSVHQYPIGRRPQRQSPCRESDSVQSYDLDYREMRANR
uniref:C2 domain-containing protein n=1 Tax=Fundulus heteroclitus TaxID=8078 RepID=A0A3Q2QN92_FUNHE